MNGRQEMVLFFEKVKKVLSFFGHCAILVLFLFFSVLLL